jgi:hypothetical protein
MSDVAKNLNPDSYFDGLQQFDRSGYNWLSGNGYVPNKTSYSAPSVQPSISGLKPMEALAAAQVAGQVGQAATGGLFSTINNGITTANLNWRHQQQLEADARTNERTLQAAQAAQERAIRAVQTDQQLSRGFASSESALQRRFLGTESELARQYASTTRDLSLNQSRELELRRLAGFDTIDRRRDAREQRALDYTERRTDADIASQRFQQDFATRQYQDQMLAAKQLGLFSPAQLQGLPNGMGYVQAGGTGASRTFQPAARYGSVYGRI